MVTIGLMAIMLTKSNFMKYIECPIYLWLSKHRPGLLPENTPELERIFATGREVDELAKKLFPAGVEVGGFNQEGWKNTKQAMAKNPPVLFQPTAVTDHDLSCRADILTSDRKNGVWDIHEVKMGTQVKPENIIDVAFQRNCFENAGIPIGRTSLVHINNKYVRHGDINPAELFASEDITDLAVEAMDEVKRMIPLALEILGRTAVPDEKLLSTCENPKTCEYLKIYLESIGHKIELQKIEEVTDTLGIQEALSELQYPLYFLDYETYGAAIPPFDDTRPYQNIPFQYSLGIKDSPDAETRYMEFLARKFENPVSDLLEQLNRDMGDKGSVVVWNQGFEKGCNEEMGIMVPAYAPFLMNVNERVFDLMLIFKLKRQLYTRNAFKGSASLKKVLPAICPELAYDDLAIQEGGTASASWPIMTSTTTPEDERSRLAENMLLYCKRDTEAMVGILEKVKKEISEK